MNVTYNQEYDTHLFLKDKLVRVSMERKYNVFTSLQLRSNYRHE
jgi:hypothetical protein